MGVLKRILTAMNSNCPMLAFPTVTLKSHQGMGRVLRRRDGERGAAGQWTGGITPMFCGPVK
jgi:hypothetical protein